MSSAIRIFQAAQDLGTLRDLIDLVKNPKVLIDAHETARQQQALTEEEARKAAEARDFISRYNGLSRDLESSRKKLFADKAEYEADRADTEEAHRLESERLSNLAKELENKQRNFAHEKSVLADEKKVVKAEKDSIKQEFEDMLRQLGVKAAADEKLKADNEVESKRLAEARQELDAKYTKLQEITTQ